MSKRQIVYVMKMLSIYVTKACYWHFKNILYFSVNKLSSYQSLITTLSSYLRCRHIFDIKQKKSKLLVFLKKKLIVVKKKENK